MPAGRTARPKPDDGHMPDDLVALDPHLPAAEGDLHVMKDRTFSAFPAPAWPSSSSSGA